MVEPQPSKLMMWVRFPSPAPYRKSQAISYELQESLKICRIYILWLVAYGL